MFRCLLLCFFCGIASAAPIQYELNFQRATGPDDATGVFWYDAETEEFSGLSILWLGYEWEDFTGGLVGADVFAAFSNGEIMWVGDPNLPDEPYFVLFSEGMSWAIYSSKQYIVSQGVASAGVITSVEAVPEPGTLLLLGLGLGLFLRRASDPHKLH